MKAPDGDQEGLYRDLVRHQLELDDQDEDAPLAAGTHEAVVACLLHRPPQRPDLLDVFVDAGKGSPAAIADLVTLAQTVLQQQERLDTEGPGLLAEILRRCEATGTGAISMVRSQFEQAWANGLRLRGR